MSFAQEHPFTVKFSYQIEAELAAEEIRPDRAALHYSLISDYYNSISFSRSSVSWGVDSLDLSNYSIVDALSKLKEEAQDYQIVIVSENHYRPQHRIFSKKLITELSKIGFKHLGMEALIVSDTNLNIRGYPLLDKPLTGVLTLEPKMGDLVRTSLGLGFNLFGYDVMQETREKDRDEIQADNIIAYLEQHPNSRIILHCGHYHAIESSFFKRKSSYYMAKILKDKLGIDPLTIYQDNFTEKVGGNEHPILRELKIDEPSIFVDQAGEIVSLTEHVDIEVIHPKTYYLKGRPNWLYESETYKPIDVKWRKFDVGFPIIVSAHPINEVNSVPFDRIELKHKNDWKVLVLETGEYRISIYDGTNTWEYNQTVK